MNWFYADAGKQAGPVNDADFEGLVREGVIQPATLVWRDGLANWQPLSVARPDLLSVPTLASQPSATGAPSGQVICAECGKPVLVEETIQIGAATVCSACKPTYIQKLREGAITFTTPAAPMRYAGFWIRAAALLIDGLIMNIVSLPFTLWFTVRMQQAVMGGRFDWASYFGYLGLSTGISTVMSLLYNVLFVGRYGGTPGKMILKIKIVRADGSKVSYLRALGRFGGTFISSLACCIGYLFPLWDSEKRALHDYICDTRVVYK